MQPASQASQTAAALRLPLGRLALACAALIALCYAGNLRDFFLSDDFCTLAVHAYQPGVAGVFGLGEGQSLVFLRPLTDLSWAINWAISGLEPLGYHLLNLGFHLASAVLLALLTLELGRSRAAAWIAGASFACFPLHPEAVTWANGRVDVLCACGVLASLLCWARFCAHPARLRLLIGSALSFVAALGCKEMALTLPVLASVIALLCYRAGGAKIWRGLLLLYALLLAYLLVRWLALGGVAGYADGQGRSLLLDSTLAKGLDFLRFSALRLFAPSSWLLVGTPARAFGIAPVLVWGLALCLCITLRVPRRSWIVAACFALMCLVSMAPVIGWAQFVAGQNEPWRFLYLPSAFACAGLGMGFSFASAQRPRWVRAAAWSLALLLLASNVIALRVLNARWHAAAVLSQQMIEGIRERYARQSPQRPLVHAPVARVEQGVSVFHNGFPFAVQLWVGREIPIYPQGKWRIMNLRGDPLPSEPPLQLVWEHEARTWRDF